MECKWLKIDNISYSSIKKIIFFCGFYLLNEKSFYSTYKLCDKNYEAKIQIMAFQEMCSCEAAAAAATAVVLMPVTACPVEWKFFH